MKIPHALRSPRGLAVIASLAAAAIGIGTAVAPPASTPTPAFASLASVTHQIAPTPATSHDTGSTNRCEGTERDHTESESKGDTDRGDDGRCHGDHRDSNRDESGDKEVGHREGDTGGDHRDGGQDRGGDHRDNG